MGKVMEGLHLTIRGRKNDFYNCKKIVDIKQNRLGLKILLK
jgi:hypothetical protein